MRAQDVANKSFRLGTAFAVALGGLAFNVGNVGGAPSASGLFGTDQMMGAVISGHCHHHLPLEGPGRPWTSLPRSSAS